MGAIEHVPAKELTAFFEHAKTLLKPGGLFLNHGITSSDVKRLPAGPSFVDAFVFPDSGEKAGRSSRSRVSAGTLFTYLHGMASKNRGERTWSRGEIEQVRPQLASYPNGAAEANIARLKDSRELLASIRVARLP